MPDLMTIATRPGHFCFSEWAVRNALGIEEDVFFCEGQEGIRSWHDPLFFEEAVTTESTPPREDGLVCTISSKDLWVAPGADKHDESSGDDSGEEPDVRLADLFDNCRPRKGTQFEKARRANARLRAPWHTRDRAAARDARHAGSMGYAQTRGPLGRELKVFQGWASTFVKDVHPDWLTDVRHPMHGNVTAEPDGSYWVIWDLVGPRCTDFRLNSTGFLNRSRLTEGPDHSDWKARHGRKGKYPKRQWQRHTHRSTVETAQHRNLWIDIDLTIDDVHDTGLGIENVSSDLKDLVAHELALEAQLQQAFEIWWCNNRPMDEWDDAPSADRFEIRHLETRYADRASLQEHHRLDDAHREGLIARHADLAWNWDQICAWADETDTDDHNDEQEHSCKAEVTEAEVSSPPKALNRDTDLDWDGVHEEMILMPLRGGKVANERRQNKSYRGDRWYHCGRQRGGQLPSVMNAQGVLCEQHAPRAFAKPSWKARHGNSRVRFQWQRHPHRLTEAMPQCRRPWIYVDLTIDDVFADDPVSLDLVHHTKPFGTTLVERFADDHTDVDNVTSSCYVTCGMISPDLTFGL